MSEMPTYATKAQNTDGSKCWWRCRTLGALTQAGRIAKMSITHEDGLATSYQTKHIFLLYDLPVMLSGSYLKQLNKTKQTLHINLSIDCLLRLYSWYIKNWKQPKCLSVGSWINRLWHSHTAEYYSVLKGNAPSSHKQTGGTFGA